MMITELPLELALLILAIMIALLITAVGIVVLAVRRWSYAASWQAQALDRLATAVEKGALQGERRL